MCYHVNSMKKLYLSFLSLLVNVLLFAPGAQAQSDSWTVRTDHYDHRTVAFEYPERFEYSASSVNYDDRLSHFPMRVITLNHGEELLSISYFEEINGAPMLRNLSLESVQNAEHITYGANEGTLYMRPLGETVRMFHFVAGEYVFIVEDNGSGIDQAEWDRFVSSIHVTTANIAPVPPPYNNSVGIYHSLCKSEESPTVYWCDLVRKSRHPFANEYIFKSWQFDFKDVQVLSGEEIASMDLGSPVLPPRGTWIKIQSKSEVYEVQRDGKTLRWISDEDTALAMRGPEWNTDIHTLDVTLWQYFQIGSPIKINAL